jgi:hypothetical protein
VAHPACRPPVPIYIGESIVEQNCSKTCSTLPLSPVTRRFVETTMAIDKKSQRGRHGNWEI